MTVSIPPTAILAGCAAIVVLSAWLPVVTARRWAPARWRAFTASVGSVVVLVLGGWLAVLAFSSLPGR